MFNCNVIVWKAVQDTLSKNSWHDPFRCHDVHVLHWLMNQSYKCLVTYMCAPVKGSLLADQGLPPRERMSLEDARIWFLNIWVGKNTILDMFVELGLPPCGQVVP